MNNFITVTTPNGGENWFVTQSYEIVWTDDITGNVKIELFKAGDFNSTIVSSTPSISPFLWNIAESIITGSDFKIKI